MRRQDRMVAQLDPDDSPAGFRALVLRFERRQTRLAKLASLAGRQRPRSSRCQQRRRPSFYLLI